MTKLTQFCLKMLIMKRPRISRINLAYLEFLTGPSPRKTERYVCVRVHVCVCVCVYIYTHMHIYIYIQLLKDECNPSI
jgi:hypothetical protein